MIKFSDPRKPAKVQLSMKANQCNLGTLDRGSFAVSSASDPLDKVPVLGSSSASLPELEGVEVCVVSDSLSDVPSPVSTLPCRLLCT